MHNDDTDFLGPCSCYVGLNFLTKSDKNFDIKDSTHKILEFETFSYTMIELHQRLKVI